MCAWRFDFADGKSRTPKGSCLGQELSRLTIEYSILKVKCVAVSGPASLEELVVGLMVRVPEFEPTIRIALRMPSERT